MIGASVGGAAAPSLKMTVTAGFRMKLMSLANTGVSPEITELITTVTAVNLWVFFNLPISVSMTTSIDLSSRAALFCRAVIPQTSVVVFVTRNAAAGSVDDHRKPVILPAPGNTTKGRKVTR